MAFGLYVGSLTRDILSNGVWTCKKGALFFASQTCQTGLYAGSGALYQKYLATNLSYAVTLFLAAGSILQTLSVIGLAITGQTETPIEKERIIISSIELAVDSALFALVNKVDKLTLGGKCFLIAAVFADTARLVYHIIEAIHARQLQREINIPPLEQPNQQNIEL